MAVTQSAPRLELNSRPVTATDLIPALSGYGHFTAMQVRADRVRGLGFHLARLDVATRELFDVELPGDRVMAHLRHALSGPEPVDASVRINVFSPADNSADGVSVLVTVRPPADMPAGPLSVASVPYQRPFPHLKHVGGFAQGHHIKLVERRGFDEALLVGPDGRIAEGAITNIGFVAAGSVLWPDAPMLLGTGMQVLQRELATAAVPQQRRPITLADLGSFDGAFVVNSRGVAAVSRIDDVDLPLSAPLLGRVLDLYGQAPWDVI